MALSFDQPCAALAALRFYLLAAGQLLIVFPLLAVGFLALCAPLSLVLRSGGSAPLRGQCRAFKAVWPQAIHSKGRGSRLDRGNPEGVPRPQAALRRSFLCRMSSYPRFLVLQLLVFKYLKKAICSKLLVGAVDNPEKLGVARVCGLWKSRMRE
ncbi:hypothetical protein [Aeromonas caviae]|uniref:hypothetical protein n=1 Tax=Aeromonas caviae TaxID=648 RepID=UPI001CC72BBC|nr:hypothetical protein [Aeromonas caviae]